MVRLTAHIPPLANLAAGSLLFGQFLSDRPYSLAIAWIGVGTWIVLFGAALYIAAGGTYDLFSGIARRHYLLCTRAGPV